MDPMDIMTDSKATCDIAFMLGLSVAMLILKLTSMRVSLAYTISLARDKFKPKTTST